MSSTQTRTAEDADVLAATLQEGDTTPATLREKTGLDETRAIRALGLLEGQGRIVKTTGGLLHLVVPAPAPDDRLQKLRREIVTAALAVLASDGPLTSQAIWHAVEKLLLRIIDASTFAAVLDSLVTEGRVRQTAAARFVLADAATGEPESSPTDPAAADKAQGPIEIPAPVVAQALAATAQSVPEPPPTPDPAPTPAETPPDAVAALEADVVGALKTINRNLAEALERQQREREKRARALLKLKAMRHTPQGEALGASILREQIRQARKEFDRTGNPVLKGYLPIGELARRAVDMLLELEGKYQTALQKIDRLQREVRDHEPGKTPVPSTTPERTAEAHG